MKRVLPLFCCVLTGSAIAGNDSFRINGASAREVRQAMNDLGADGLMNAPGPRCVKSLLVSGGVDESGRIEYRALGGALGTATGQLYEDAEGTNVHINTDVISERMHRGAMGTPEDMARKVAEQVHTNRLRRRP